MSTATPTTTPIAKQAGPPSRVAIRWYQFAVIVLGVALAAVIALAVYFAVNNSTDTVVPRSPSGPVAEQPCWQPQVPC
jgi:uncharacterized RDD family membrane protein YckC